MNFKILILTFYMLGIVGCTLNNNHKDQHEHDDYNHLEHEHRDEGCNHDKEEAHDGITNHEEVKFQYTAYSNHFELFAEADAFVVGETGNVLAHFSELPEFKATVKGKITIVLTVGGQQTKQTLLRPTRKGIYRFDIKPKTAGKGSLIFEIINHRGSYKVIVPDVEVFANDKDAHKAVEENEVSKTNTVVFTKEQAWKIEYASAYPVVEPFGQVIKTTAMVQSAPEDEYILSAKASGLVRLTNNQTLEGNEVLQGQVLFSISGSDLAEDNMSVRYAEAKNNYHRAKQDYERAQKLIIDKIISDKDFRSVKNQYDNAHIKFKMLSKNFNSSGQMVSSPRNGFVKEVWVKNGQYVEAGQPVVTISQNKKLVLSADVQQKYVSDLRNIITANIRSVNSNRSFTLEELNGSVLSVGKSTSANSYLLPVKLQIYNDGSFTLGTFVEVYLKIRSSLEALTVPNTSILENQGIYFVYVQVTAELFEKREVKIGTSDGKKTEIRQGITSDERVVTKGAMLIKLAEATGTLDAHSGHVH